MNEGDFFNAEVVKGRVSLLKKEKMWWGKKKRQIGEWGKNGNEITKNEGKTPKMIKIGSLGQKSKKDGKYTKEINKKDVKKKPRENR